MERQKGNTSHNKVEFSGGWSEADGRLSFLWLPFFLYWLEGTWAP